MDTTTTTLMTSVIDSSGSAGTTLEVGYNVNLSADVVAFADSLERVDSMPAVENVELSAFADALFAPLEYINDEAGALVEYAQNAVASGNELSPSEVVMLTARSQEFMFHSQLTANVANRTAEGLQQLFRQQS